MKEKDAVRECEGATCSLEEYQKVDNSKRQPCEIWTRVMGYMRPVSGWNTGKKSEFYSREYFDEEKTLHSLAVAESNKQFNEKH